MIPDAVLGPLAGVTTSAFWAITSLLFTSAGLRLGATRVNALRLGAAVVMLGAVHVIGTGTLFPALPTEQLRDLAISGVVGLTLCDQALFLAFVLIGPRRVLLVETLAPLFGLLLGAAFLDEITGGRGLLGVAITLAGVAWVVRERPAAGRIDVPRDVLVRGLSLAVVAALLQATGAFLAKRGMGHGVLPASEHVPPLEATYVRMVFGALGMLPVLLVHARLKGRGAVLVPGQVRKGVLLTLVATVFGPVLGVWLSLVAFDLTPLGVALTLLALSPVLVLPLARVVHGERVSLRAILGAVVAVIGTALLAFGR